jgi:hypothetical protein
MGEPGKNFSICDPGKAQELPQTAGSQNMAAGVSTQPGQWLRHKHGLTALAASLGDVAVQFGNRTAVMSSHSVACSYSCCEQCGHSRCARQLKTTSIISGQQYF